jgi:hypothetical protein
MAEVAAMEVDLVADTEAVLEEVTDGEDTEAVLEEVTDGEDTEVVLAAFIVADMEAATGVVIEAVMLEDTVTMAMALG